MKHEIKLAEKVRTALEQWQDETAKLARLHAHLHAVRDVDQTLETVREFKRLLAESEAKIAKLRSELDDSLD